MLPLKITRVEKNLIKELVEHFKNNIDDIEGAIDQVRGLVTRSKILRPHIHSLKWRVKDPDHLADKLERKLIEHKAKRKAFAITKKNLFWKINDLAGLRILHLHTRQIEQINLGLDQIFNEARYILREGPIAKTWDDESRKFFSGIGIRTEKSETMYTSVHYVIELNRRTRITCEIQVRTLMEEVWGEVDHELNYPHPTTSIACKEQISALARSTSACTRLVDSIFRSSDEEIKRKRVSNSKGQRKKGGKST